MNDPKQEFIYKLCQFVDDYEDPDILGYFSIREKAEEYKKLHIELMKKRHYEYKEYIIIRINLNPNFEKIIDHYALLDELNEGGYEE